MTNNPTTNETSNPSFYDADSSTYDQARWNSKGGGFTNLAQQSIVSSLCAQWREKQVIEIGPGTARFTIPLTKMGNHMTLVDISSGMLATAKENIEAAGTIANVDDFVEGSIYDLPFEDGTFDHAFSLNVFNHLEHPGEALNQMARVIKPGSTLLFNYANLHSYFWPAARKINKSHTAVGQDVYSTWERHSDMNKHISAAGLTLVQRLGNVHVPRGLEKYPVRPIIKVLDTISRSGPLKGFAPFQFCLCRKD